jgi:cytochrome P450
VSAALPTLPGWPGLGHLPAFRRDPLGLLERFAALPGPLWRLRLGWRSLVLGSGPEVAEALLVELAPSLEKGPLVRRWSRPLLGDGLISASTAVHGEHRAQVAAAFSGPRRQVLLSALGGAAARAVALIPAGAEVDLAATARRLVAAVIAPALYPGSRVEAWKPVVAALDPLNIYLAARIRNPLLPPVGWPTPAARRAAAALRSFDAAVETLIEERRPGVAGRGEQRADPLPDLLDLLLALPGPGEGGSTGRRRVRDEVVTFLAAGYETTATVLTWALALLAWHPEVAARLRAEALALAAGEPLGAEHLGRLSICEQVIKEVLRLWPPVHTLGRRVRREVTLLGHRLPPGTIVAFSTYLLHRRPELYPDPERFAPERFARPAQTGAGRFTYLPFGAGPRACIGGELALSALKLLVASIVLRHDLQLAAGTPLTPELLVTLRPRAPLRFRFLAGR